MNTNRQPDDQESDERASNHRVSNDHDSDERGADDPLYSDEYYEFLEQHFGAEKAAWARLPRRQREIELARLHELYNTPDDLDLWPPELGGGVDNP